MKTEGGERNNNTNPQKWFRAPYWDYKLFLDDNRNVEDVYYKTSLPNGKWVIVRNYDDFVSTIIKKGLPTFISFDHDLDRSAVQEYIKACQAKRPFNYFWVKEKTGRDCAEFLIEYCKKNALTLPEYHIHSANHLGVENIKKILQNII